MTTTATDVAAIAPIGHGEAMAWAGVEVRLLLEAVDRLAPTDWSRPTDCTAWDVKALLSHMLGAMEGNASIREFVRQYRVAAKAAKHSGQPLVDEVTAAQVRDKAKLSPAHIAARIHETAPAALAGRRRMPALLRAAPIKPGAPFEGTWKLGYVVDVIMNRDSWMHRVDLSRATGQELVLTPDHDGRIVADVVAEWALTHGQPFTLVLTGPAGNTFVQGDRGEEIRCDAVEFCRTLSGRAQASGLLGRGVPF